uniref:Uncharacterized protein n=1 Tax=Hemiselmis andersenii TaxID=464988 RepID=A0A7S1EL96_HEMAN|mmetsp:Transcript_5368/g.12910  ORF Transcript_5368/g.12910 Transcript_5368/m.12910 type:complete len:159 (+) Transcript_5368:48-524(+)
MSYAPTYGAPVSYAPQPALMQTMAAPVQYAPQPIVATQPYTMPAPAPVPAPVPAPQPVYSAPSALAENDAPPGYRLAGYAPAPDGNETTEGWEFVNNKWIYVGKPAEAQVVTQQAPAPIVTVPQPVTYAPAAPLTYTMAAPIQQPVTYGAPAYGAPMY